MPVLNKKNIDFLGDLDPTTQAKTAFITSDTKLTYQQLQQQIVALASTLPSGKRLLIHLPLGRNLADIIAYLAALYAGHVVLLTTNTKRLYEPIIQNYSPDISWNGTNFIIHSTTPQHVLNSELALLMSTSGTTGSAKLIRLSQENILSNSQAISKGLQISTNDRTLTTLPLYYSFGLSILHTHLQNHASIYLTENSINEPNFWQIVTENEITNLAVVPHQLELLTTSAIPTKSKLRLIYQAGGKLAVDKVKFWARTGQKMGWDFIVMYGQTEATARISIMPSIQTLKTPDAVGYPIANTQVKSNAQNELLVYGPGVMLGYATRAEDLALGRMLDYLPTGDLGTVSPEGLIRITGRANDFLKIAGLRIALGEIENVLATRGIQSCVTGDDERLRVAVKKNITTPTPENYLNDIKEIIIKRTGLDHAHISIAEISQFPLLENQKIDRKQCDKLVREQTQSHYHHNRLQQLKDGLRRNKNVPIDIQINTELCKILGKSTLNLEKSFADNGGTSLNHVPATVALLKILEKLPANWHHLPLQELTKLPARKNHYRSLAQIDVSVIIRMIAVLTILINHVLVFSKIPAPSLLGGAHSLLVIAGYNLAAFNLALPQTSARIKSTLKVFLQIAIPTASIALIGIFITGRYGWSNALFMNWFYQAPHASGALWFIDAYLLNLIFLTVIFSLPLIYKSYQQHPWVTSLLLTNIAFVGRFIGMEYDPEFYRRLPFAILWLMLLGMLIYNSITWWQKLIPITIYLIAGYNFFTEPNQYFYILIVIILLTFIKSIPVPLILLPAINLISASSLYIYIIQFDIYRFVPPLWAKIVLPIVAGISLWMLVTKLTNLITRKIIHN